MRERAGPACPARPPALPRPPPTEPDPRRSCGLSSGEAPGPNRRIHLRGPPPGGLARVTLQHYRRLRTAPTMGSKRTAQPGRAAWCSREEPEPWPGSQIQRHPIEHGLERRFNQVATPAALRELVHGAPLPPRPAGRQPTPATPAHPRGVGRYPTHPERVRRQAPPKVTVSTLEQPPQAGTTT